MVNVLNATPSSASTSNSSKLPNLSTIHFYDICALLLVADDYDAHAHV